MARKMTDTAKYFPHDANASAGDTLTMLQAEFKNDGYAFWFRLLERLAAADSHYLDMRNGSKWRTLAAKSYIDEQTADRIMEILIETEAIDIGLWKEHKIIWCRNLVDNLADVYRNRRREMPQKPIVKDGIITCNYGVTTGQTKQDKTKLNKIKDSSSSSINGNNSASLEKVLDLYAESIGLTTVQATEHINAAYDIYGGDWLIEAIKEACRQNKPKWSYVEGILQNWQQYGYKDPSSRYHIVKRG